MWQKIFGWALTTAASAPVKTAGLEAAKQAIASVQKVIDDHATDGTAVLRPMADALAAALTGFINSKEG